MIIPDDALRALAGRLKTTSIEPVVGTCVGRVLAEAIHADRDSPAADVSAMDGYAVRLSDLTHEGSLAVVGESACGSPPPEMPAEGVLRIFTGAMVPEGCQVVIKREETIESTDSIELREEARGLPDGANIRRSGENLSRGSVVVESGTLVTGATEAALVNFGCCSAEVFQSVQVGILTTGNEVVSVEAQPQPWQLRNSNGMSLDSILAGKPWIDVGRSEHCADEKTKLVESLQESLAGSDAVIMTGGVSMGDYDFVPDVIREVGGEVIFHGLPIRPGKPILGAVTSEGKLIVGLPGNPVSAIVNARRMVLPLLAKMSGQTDWLRPMVKVQVQGLPNRKLPLHQMILVRVDQEGRCEVVPSKGSGDLVALGNSDGFVEIPPHATATSGELRSFFPW